MTANKFVLKGNQIEVDYSISAIPGVPTTLVYSTGGTDSKSFLLDEVKTATGLGDRWYGSS